MAHSLFLSLYFPYWSIDLYRRRSFEDRIEKPLLLTQEKHGQCIVVCPCPISRAQGVEPDTPLALAEALLDKPPLHSPYRPEKDFAMLYKTALALLRFSPLVGIENLGSIGSNVDPWPLHQ